MSITTKVVFVVPYPLRRAPSQRFRVEQFFPFLEEGQIRYEVAPFLDSATFSVLYSDSSLVKKSFGVIKGFLKRFLLLFKLSNTDYVFIHREASPLGPPFFEFIVSKILRKALIYDFDDAIWIPDNGSGFLRWAKCYWKVRRICAWSQQVIAGNTYLSNYASQFNSTVTVIPTCVDVVGHHNRLNNHQEEPVTIGWTGSHSTLKYLHPLAPVLKSLCADGRARVVIICNERPKFDLDFHFIKWNEDSEIPDLLKIEIGLMPLTEDPWSQGKCGFKLIQYMALGIVAVASPVGVNSTIIDQGVTGFLCRSAFDWEQTLSKLIGDRRLRKKLGAAAREKIVSGYSIQAYKSAFLQIFSKDSAPS